MVVQRRHLEQAAALAVAALGVLEPADLQHHRQRFDDEDAAHDRQHDFLPHDHGDGAQGAAQRQRADVAHEHLRRVRVEPQERQARARHRGAEDQQLAGAGNVGKQQVFRIHRAAGHVGKDPKRRTDHDHRHDRQPIQPIGQVDRIARTHDHQVAQDHEAEHAKRIADFLEERQQQAGGRRQVDREAGTDPVDEQLPHLGVGALGNAEHQVERGRQANE